MKDKYFPTKNDCSCKMNSLNPNEIKQYFKKELYRSNIKPKQFYIEVAKLLGYKAWDEYKLSYNEDILPFMKKNGLHNYARNENILKSKHDIYFNYREISDRLFLSKKPYPKSIFTGYSCKTDFIEHYYKNRIKIPDLTKEEYQKLLIVNKFDLLIPVEVGDFYIFRNLLGDAFLKYENDYNYEYIFEEYMDNIGLYENKSQKNNAIKFHNIILELDKGWLEVIPFNDNLIFLKASNGNYDYVFKNIRNDKFVSPYYDFVKHENIPTLLNEDYDFSRWLYYGYKDTIKIKKDIKLSFNWEQMDSHKAEINFYKSNKRENYPGFKEILKSYYMKEGKYSYNRKVTNEVIPKFNKIKLNENKLLCLSNLITIEEFYKFYNEKYNRSKTLDEIMTINDDNKDYPVSVTWYDAIAYCRYIENEYKVPTRLITRLEYKEISPKIKKPLEVEDFKTYEAYFDYTQSKDYRINHNPFWTMAKEDLRFIYNDKEFNGPPPYMKDFENVIMKYKKQMDFTNKNGINFSKSSTFVEWTNDFRGVHAGVMSIKHANSSAKGYLSASSNNKYKYLKVGFRVCYELDNTNDDS